MNHSIHEISSFLLTEKDSITDEILRKTIEKNHLHINHTEIANHKRMVCSLLAKISNSLVTSSEEMHTEAEHEQARLNFQIYPLPYTLKLLSWFRTALFEILSNKSDTFQLPKEQVIGLIGEILDIFDSEAQSITYNYILSEKKILKSMKKEMNELAAPIVPIRTGIAVIPLIGELQEERANYITTEVLPKVAGMGVEILILDFSGIKSFDTYVAHHLFHISDILQLLGIETIITGINPHLAQVAVQLGIEIRIKTYKNVQQALEKILANPNHQQKHQ